MNEHSNRDTDAIAEELRRVVDHAEELMQNAGVGEHLSELRERVNETLTQAKAKLADLEKEARVQGKRAAAATETWVRANPWTALAIGAGIGLIIGAVLLTRSGSDSVDDSPY